MEYQGDSPSLKNKLKSSLCLSCCFRSRGESLSSGETPRSARAPSSTWLKSRAHEFPEIKDKCRNLMSRIGRGRRHSADYSYDPLSYSLNFDEGFDDQGHVNEHPLRNFSSRLPPSPPRVAVADRVAVPEVVAPRGITACN